MSRSTHASPLVVTCPEWGPQESVTLRTIYTKGDKAWINAQAMKVESDQSGNMIAAVDVEMNAAATVAKMLVSWTLTQDKVDSQGNPLYMPDGTIMQEPRPLSNPTDIFARLEDVKKLHDADADYIFNQLSIFISERDAAKEPKTEKQQQDFIADAPVLTSTTVG